MQFNVQLISRRQPISSTGDYPLLLKGVPEAHLCAHLMGTDRDPSSHIDVRKLQSDMAGCCRFHSATKKSLSTSHCPHSRPLVFRGLWIMP